MSLRHIVLFVAPAVAAALLALVAILAPVRAQPSPTPPLPAGPVDVTGSWTVSCREEVEHACGDTKSRPVALWTVTKAPERKLEVTVSGDETFPKLTGRMRQSTRTLQLEGTSAQPFFSTAYNFASNTHFYSSTTYTLALKDNGEFSGTRQWNGYRKLEARPGVWTPAFVPCAVTSVCTGKRAD
jgi:hypothetical protein